MTYRTCHHANDNGTLCRSAAVTDRDYCWFHLRHRGNRMRMAQARARNQRCPLSLPPLENMHAVQSALTQVMQALEADMIDPKRAQCIVSVLRVAANNLKRPEAWRASEYHNDRSVASVESYDEFESEFGLPRNLDLNAPPEVVFPPAPGPAASPGVSAGGSHPAAFAAAEVFAAGPRSSDAGSGAETAASSGGTLDFRPDYPLTPETVEVCEIYETQGPDAAQVRCDQLERNRRLRQRRSDRKRYAEIALRQNLRRAADQLARQKLAERAAVQDPPPESQSARKPPLPAGTEEKRAVPFETKSTA